MKWPIAVKLLRALGLALLVLTGDVALSGELTEAVRQVLIALLGLAPKL